MKPSHPHVQHNPWPRRSPLAKVGVDRILFDKVRTADLALVVATAPNAYVSSQALSIPGP